MATDKGYIAYVMEQLYSLPLSSKPMFGEYGVYLDEKLVALVCDNNVFVKIMPETTAVLTDECETGYPYDGAKLHYVLDIDDRDLAQKVLYAVYDATPLRAKRSKVR